MVSLIVIAWPIALWGASGATTITSPKVVATSMSALIPGAVMPSSFVTKINGFFAFFGALFLLQKYSY